MVNEEFSENDASETPEEEPKVHYDVFYRCLRCGTHASNTELDKLPEIKCICGFRDIPWRIVCLHQVETIL